MIKNIDKIILEALSEDLIRIRDKVYTIGPADRDGNRPLLHRNRIVGFMRPDDSYELSPDAES